MQVNSGQNAQPSSAVGVGVLFGVGIIGMAIIIALLYALW